MAEVGGQVHIAPLICTLRYFSSRTAGNSTPAALQSRIFSASGPLGLTKCAARCDIRNSRTWLRLSNASSWWINARERRWYLHPVKHHIRSWHQRRLVDVRLGHYKQRTETFTVDKMIHDIRPHVWGIEILVKESMIISKSKGTLHGQRMLHRRRCFLFGR